MLKKFKKYSWLGTIILTAALLNFLAPQTASAACSINPLSLPECFKDALMSVISFIAGVIAFVSAFFLWIAGFLVNFSFNMNLELGQNEIITAGWKVTNALANLGFVLAIIIIAFATILRFPGYGWKEILWKLIAAALLINFSLLIAFVFIDFSNVLTRYFLDVATDNNSVQVAASLANAFRIQALRKPPAEVSAKNAQESITVGLASLVFEVIFNFVIFMTLLALAAMLFVRYIALSILLILAPLVWFFWVLPYTQKWWREWWDSFIKWVIFAPAVTLFIFIAISTANSTAMQATITKAQTNAGEGMASDKSPKKDIFPQLANMVVLVGILLGGLITANKMGIAGSAMFYGAVKTTGKMAQGWVGGKAKGGYEGIRDRALTLGAKPEKLDDKGNVIENKKLSYAQRLAVGAAAVPGFRGAALGISRASEKAKQNVEKYQKDKLTPLTNEALESQIKSELATAKITRIPLNPDKTAAFGAEVAKRGITSNFKDEDMDTFLKAAYRTGTEKSILAVRPDFADKVGKTEKEAMKYVSPNNFVNIDHRAFDDPDKARKILFNDNVSNGHLTKAQDASPELKNAIRKTFGEFEAVAKTLRASTAPLSNLQKEQLRSYDRMRKYSRENIHIQDFVPKAPEEKNNEEPPKRQAGFTSPDIPR